MFIMKLLPAPYRFLKKFNCLISILRTRWRYKFQISNFEKLNVNLRCFVFNSRYIVNIIDLIMKKQRFHRNPAIKIGQIETSLNNFG